MDRKQKLKKMLDDEKDEAAEHLDLIGEDFLFAISRMIQDFKDSNEID